MAPRSRIPLDLSVEVETASGTRYQLADDLEPERRLRGVTFSSEIGDGFKTAGGNLPRRFDIDYPDLNLVDTWSFVGRDGTVAWEGRASSFPRSLTDRSTISVNLTGWMSHATDQKFREIYVDRDLNAWQGPSLGRQAATMTANYIPTAGTVVQDVADATSGVVTAWEGNWASPYLPLSDAWYDAGTGLTIGRIDYSWKVQPGGLDYTNAQFNWIAGVSIDDKATATQTTANLRAAGPSASSFVPTVRYRYGLLQLLYGTTGAGIAGGHYGLAWYNLAVYGAHGLTLYTGDPGQPPGVLASDVIRDIARRFAPKLDTSGVQNTTYPIQHLVFKDRTTPYDAFAQVNKYHLFNLAVWENKRLEFKRYDLDDYDWQIRAGENGATFDAQGQSTDNVYDSVVVGYTDLNTQTKNYLTPDVYTQLQATDLLNPWRMQGIDKPLELELSAPTTITQAVAIGRIALAEANRPKAPGTITAKAYIKDRAGIEQPVWRVRAGDTIAITNHQNDSPRLIHSASYDHDSHTVTIAVDAPPAVLDGVVDRIGTSLTARGLA